ncbi:MAG: flagellar hook-length control protein FliK [Mariprofundales bacterium]
MMNAQVTTAASGSPAESSVSGVLKEQGKKGGLFAVLMQAFQSHLKAGLSGAGLSGEAGDTKVQGKDVLASLLQGKHGKEISALLAKLSKGNITPDAKLLDGLSSQALAALKLALAQNIPMQSADGSVDLTAQIKTALNAMPADGAKATVKESAKDQAKTEDGSSLQVGLVAAGVQVVQSKPTTGGLKQQQEAGAKDGDGEMDGKEKNPSLGMVGKKEASGKGNSEQINGGSAVTGKGNAGKADIKQANAGDAVTANTTGAEQNATAVTTETNHEQAVTTISETNRDTAVTHASDKTVGIEQTSSTQTAPTQTASTQTTANSQSAIKGDVDARLQHAAADNPLTKDSVVTIAKSADDAAPQDDGVAASTAFRPIASVPGSHLAANNDGSSARVAQQALANAQGNQHSSGSGAGDNGSQNSNRSTQGGFEGLLTNQRADQNSTARGAEFATQLGYKSATTWKPADAMLQIGRAAADGAMRLDLQLSPAHLGKVTVSIQSDVSKQVQLHITVDNVAGRMALDQNMGQLRTALAQQGLDLGSFSMNLSSQGQQGRDQGFSSSNRGQQSSGFRIESDSIMVEGNGAADMGINRAGAGRLSVLA